VLAAVTLPLGITQSKEYAELEWPIDLHDRGGLGRLLRRELLDDAARRRERHMYVALWFYIATIVTVPSCTSSTTWRSARRPAQELSDLRRACRMR
jgi:cbb3-type cytochrome oxidase subunit 1